MKHTARRALVGAMTLAVALCVSAPTAEAAPHAHKTHAAKTHVTKAGASHGGKAGASAKADRQLRQAQRRLAVETRRKDRYLGRLLDRRPLARLDDTVEQPVRDSITAEKGGLDTLLEDLAGVTDLSALRGIASDVRQMRPERYNTVVNQLHLATALRDAVTADTSTDPVAVAGNQATLDALDALIAQLVTYDSTTARADLRAAQRQLSALEQDVEDEAADDEAAEDPAESTDAGTTAPGTDAGTTGTDPGTVTGSGTV